MDEIDPNIQFCAYKLQLGGSGSAQDIETLVNNLKQNNQTAAGMDLLEAQLSKVCQEQRKEKAQALAHMTWRNEQFNIKNPQLADAIVKAQATTSSSLQDHSKSVIEQFDQVLSDWADAEKRIKKLLKEDKEAISKVTSSKSAKATKELECTLTFVTYHFYSYSIQRNLALMEEIKSSGGKIQNRIKLWDDSLKVFIIERKYMGTYLHILMVQCCLYIYMCVCVLVYLFLFFLFIFDILIECGLYT